MTKGKWKQKENEHEFFSWPETVLLKCWRGIISFSLNLGIQQLLRDAVVLPE